MKKRRTIWQWIRDWWTPDDEDDADGYPGDVCLMCGGEQFLRLPDDDPLTKQFGELWKICPACKGKGTV